MSLAGFVKKKKKGKKKKVKVLNVGAGVGEQPEKTSKKKQPALPDTAAEVETEGWLDERSTEKTSSLLADQMGVVDTRTQQDKPLHENYAKDLEAEQRRMGFHDARRAFVAKGEEKKEEAPVRTTSSLTKRWGASKPSSARVNIADTRDFPSLAGGPAPVVAQPAVNNLWNKTKEENSELIHMALKAEKKEFVACTRFWGYEYGYFFKNGPAGLGYYKDLHARDMDAVEDEVGELDGEGAAESKEGEPKRRFAKKKKKKPPKEGAEGADGEKKKKKKKKKTVEEEGEEGEVKEKKKKKKKKEKSSGGADGEEADGKVKKKKKKKKKEASATAEAEAETEGGEAAN